MLKAASLSYRYGNGKWLFSYLHLTINPGEIVGLYGPSGSGKTTLAKIIAGYIQPLEGRVTVDGQLYSFNGRKTAFNPVQLVWQHPEHAVNPRWSMKKVLEEGGLLSREDSAGAASVHKISTSNNWDRDLLDELGIHHEWFTRRPSELSGGELQRFCLARALGPTTKYLIADEMTTMLDALTQAQIWHAVLGMVKQRHIGVLAISHDQHLLHRVSDRIIDFHALAKQRI